MTEAELFVQKFVDFMASQNMNVTEQRRRIAKEFFLYPGHHSLDEVYSYMQTKEKSIGQTTVYRTLKLLCLSGLVVETHFVDGLARYEVAKEGTHHDHMMCVDCNKIVEVCDERIESIQREIAQREKFVLFGHYHVMYGRCEKCAKEREEKFLGKNSSVSHAELASYK